MEIVWSESSSSPPHGLQCSKVRITFIEKTKGASNKMWMAGECVLTLHYGIVFDLNFPYITCEFFNTKESYIDWCVLALHYGKYLYNQLLRCKKNVNNMRRKTKKQYGPCYVLVSYLGLLLLWRHHEHSNSYKENI